MIPLISTTPTFSRLVPQASGAFPQKLRGKTVGAHQEEDRQEAIRIAVQQGRRFHRLGSYPLSLVCFSSRVSRIRSPMLVVASVREWR